MKRVFVVVCGNGRGHEVRVQRVMRELVRLADAGGEQVEVTTHIERSVRWWNDGHAYDDGAVLQTTQHLRDLPAFARADLVVSDNLVAPLALRPDAVLMGSFLWHDILANAYAEHEVVRQFAAHDAALLERVRPPMVCLRDFVMPAVLRCTEAIQVGFIPDREVGPRQAPAGCVVMALGKTGASDAVLHDAAQSLRTAGMHVVWRDDVDDVSSALLVIGRPGIGTVTECAAAGVPLWTLAERHNPEMRHNAERVEALGYGRAFADVASLVLAATAETLTLRQQQAPSPDLGGADVAARWLLARMGAVSTIAASP